MEETVVTDVEAIPLVSTQDPEALDGSTDTILVRITDAAGRVGVGEADAPPSVVRELVMMSDVHAWSRGLRGILLGRDAFEIRSLWADLYQATIYHGRRGLGVHAISAIDIALHDLVGKQLGRPVYQLLGGACRPHVQPYATIYPGAVKGRTIGQMMDAIAGLFENARAAGFRAIKMEVLFEDLVRDSELVHCIRDGRELLGDEITMMVDFGYRWNDWRSALWVLKRIEDCNIFFAEAPLQHDDLDGHSKLAGRVEMRVCGAELAATVFECIEWIRRGNVDVIQPDINRCGGLTEIRRIAEAAALEGVLVVPHGWKSGITAAAQRHFQAATPNAPFVEMLHPTLFPSPLREELVASEPEIVDGVVALPREPGLGVTIVEEAVIRYKADR
jgi:L-alanine-DL-glutamate epimerase-like enolase superfamily enzyme